MFELICLAYLMAYSAPVFLIPNTVRRMSRVVSISWEMMFQAQQLAFVGIVAMVVGYYVLRRNVFGWPLPRIDLPLQPRASEIYVILALVVGLVVFGLRLTHLLTSGSAWDTVINLASQQSQVAVALLAYRVHRPRSADYESFTRSRDLTLLCISVALLFLLGLSTGMLQTALTPLAIVFVIRWQAKRKFPVLIAAVGIGAFMILNPVKNEYRREAWYTAPNQGFTERLSLWIDLTRESVDSLLFNNSPEETTKDFQHSMRRFTLLHNFAEVRRQTPSVIPYYQGSTYTYLVYALIPRAIWPDKPIAQEANVRLSLDYGILTELGSRTTMIGIGHLPEAYANFGVPGVVGIMFLQGVFFALLDRILNGPTSDGARAIYLSTMIYFLNGIGSATSALFFGALLGIVPNAILLRFFSRRKRKGNRSLSEYTPTDERSQDTGQRQRSTWAPNTPMGEHGK